MIETNDRDEFQKEKRMMQAVEAAKFFNYWNPVMKWLDANGVKREDFIQNQILEFIMKKYQLPMRNRVHILLHKLQTHRNESLKDETVL